MINMIVVACFLGLVATATAAATSGCCMPDKYEFTVEDTKEIGQKKNRMSVDEVARKMAMVMTSTASEQAPTLLYRSVVHYNQSVMYVVTPDGRCTSYPWDQPYVGNCIPPDLVSKDTSYIGRDPEDGAYDVYRFQLGNANYTMVMGKDCVPIVQYIKGTIGVFTVDTTQLISDFKEGNSEPSVFQLPSSCGV